MDSAEVVFDHAAMLALVQSDEMAKDLERRALKVERQAKHLAPVDTGRLRDSITHELGRDAEGLYELIGSDVSYAIFQELGWRFSPGSPFLRPALAAAGEASSEVTSG